VKSPLFLGPGATLSNNNDQQEQQQQQQHLLLSPTTIMSENTIVDAVQKELHHLEDIYALKNMQDYIAETTTLGQNGRPHNFKGVPWPVLARQLPILKQFIADHKEYMLCRNPEDRALVSTARRLFTTQNKKKVH
jgi:hypothetical protein